MKPEFARGLAVRLNDIMKDWDTYGYADTLDEYEDSEELLLEDLTVQILNYPETVIDNMLQVMNDMLDYIC